MHSVRLMGDESFSREIFEEYKAYLQEKAKEKGRKREEEKVIEICQQLLVYIFCSLQYVVIAQRNSCSNYTISLY